MRATIKAINVSSIRRKITWLSAIWLIAGWMTTTAVRADIYTWKDADGVIHFSNHDTPPDAAIYLKATDPGPQVQTQQDLPAQNNDNINVEAIRREARAEAKLEQTHRQLDRALEKVDELTQRVSESNARAAAATEAARQATIAAQSQPVAANNENIRESRERVIVYHAPYPRHHRKHPVKYRKPYYFGPDRDRRHFRHKDRLKHDRLKQDRHRRHRINANDLNRPGRKENRRARGTYGSQRSFVPRAYGSRYHPD